MKTLRILALCFVPIIFAACPSTGTTGTAAKTPTIALTPAQQTAVDKLGATVLGDLTVLADAENAKLLQKINPASAGLAK